MAFCSNCGSEIKPEMKFCENCGTPVPGVKAPDQTVQAEKHPEQLPQQGSYTPQQEPHQDSFTQQEQPRDSYMQPEQQQGSYTSPVQPAGGPGKAAIEKKPVDKRIFIFGGAVLAVILVVVLLITLIGGKGKKAPAGDSAGSVQEIWNGNWYGYCWAVNAFGEWEHLDDYLFDAYMVIDVNKKGQGTLIIYFGDDFDGWDNWENWDIYADIEAEKNSFVITEGYFWDLELDPKNWWVGLDPVNVGNHVIISDTYLDPELTTGDGFEYIFRFRPYGETWDEEIAEGIILPPGYYDYIEEVGGSPDNSGEKEYSGLTAAELKVIYDSLPVSADLSYEEVRDQYFEGVDGVLESEDSKKASYKWWAIDKVDNYVAVNFADSKGSKVKTLVGSGAYLP